MKKYKIKKTWFIILSVYSLFGLVFYMTLPIATEPLVWRLLKTLHIDDFYLNEAILLPFAMFIIPLIIITVILWIFYRRELTVKGKIAVSCLPFCYPVSFLCLTLDNRFVNILTAIAMAVIIVLLITAIIDYPKLDEQQVIEREVNV